MLEVEPGVRAVGVKVVSANEPYFAGHFPDAPGPTRTQSFGPAASTAAWIDAYPPAMPW